MKINWTKGNKGNGDRKLNVTTSEREVFTIFKLALLCNQLSINEWKINSEKIKKTGKFFFRNAILDAIEVAELNFDWALEENINKVKDWCRRWNLKFEFIEPELRRAYQTHLEDFKDENI